MTATKARHPIQLDATVGIGWRHPHFGELLQRQPALDFVEVHSENFFAPGGAARSVLRQGRERYPVSLHGVGLSLGSANGLDAAHLDQLAALVAEIEPVRVSDHASFARGPMSQQPPLTVHASDLLPTPFTRAALDALCANVQRAQDRLRRPIAVENISAYVRWQASELNEPEFLNMLARRTGCGLLVDVNNIFVNALNDQLQGATADPLTACCDWLDAVEPHAVVELHLAGHAHAGDIVIDDHGIRVVPDVWALYRHALALFGPMPTLIEWDTNVPDLQVLLDETALAREHAGRALDLALA